MPSSPVSIGTDTDRFVDKIWTGIASLAIAAMIVLAWRYGLFTGTARSYPMLLAGIALLGLAAVGVGHLRGQVGPSSATQLLIVGMLAFVVYAGPATVFAAAVLVLCAIAIYPSRWVPPGVDGVMTGIVFGVAVLIALVGWLLPFPIHGTRLYLLLAAALCVARGGTIGQRLLVLRDGWRTTTRTEGGWLAFATCASLVAALGLWLPTMSYDDNAAHLILPYQLLRDGYYHLDASTQAWALAPWANNALNGVAALFAGSEARAAVNATWLVIGLHGAWRLAIAIGGSPRAALAAVAVYATLPLTGYFTTTMQADGASTAVLLQFAALVLGSVRVLPKATVVGAMLGLLAALKVTNAIFVLPAMAWLGWVALRQRDLRWLAQVAGMAALVGGASYVYSILVTGNPLFPLFNGTFKSPYYPAMDLVDNRWTHGLSWSALWDMTFDTGRFGEYYSGAFGIALLALLPALLVEMVRRPLSRYVALWFLLSGTLMFLQVQYMRYLFPATAVLVVVGTVGLARMAPGRSLAVLVVALAAANALLLPATSWLLREDPWSTLVLQGPSALRGIEEERVPERALLRRLLAGSPNACVILVNPQTPFGAIAAGRAVVAKAHYDTRMAQTADWANADSSGERWHQVLASTGVSHVITNAAPNEGLQQGLAANGFKRVDGQGGSLTWASPGTGAHACTGRLEHARDEAHRRFHPGDQH